MAPHRRQKLQRCGVLEIVDDKTKELANSIKTEEASIEKLTAFIEWARQNNYDLRDEAIDGILSEYFDFLCYVKQTSPSMGALVMFGLLC